MTQDKETVLQNLKLQKSLDGTTKIEIQCCGVAIERTVVASELKVTGLPRIVAAMADEAEAVAQNLYSADIIIMPDAMQVVVDHISANLPESAKVA